MTFFMSALVSCPESHISPGRSRGLWIKKHTKESQFPYFLCFKMLSYEILPLIFMEVEMLWFWQECSENVSVEFTIKLPYKVIYDKKKINTWTSPYHSGYKPLTYISTRLLKRSPDEACTHMYIIYNLK
jgi:hypothetical protein